MRFYQRLRKRWGIIKTGDERVEFVKLPDTLEGEFGSRQHPGHRSHERTAKILVEKIQEKMTLLVTP